MQNFPDCPKKRYAYVAIVYLVAHVCSCNIRDAHYPALPELQDWGPQESTEVFPLLSCFLPEKNDFFPPFPDCSASHMPSTFKKQLYKP